MRRIIWIVPGSMLCLLPLGAAHGQETPMPVLAPPLEAPGAVTLGAIEEEPPRPILMVPGLPTPRSSYMTPGLSSPALEPPHGLEPPPPTNAGPPPMTGATAAVDPLPPLDFSRESSEFDPPPPLTLEGLPPSDPLLDQPPGGQPLDRSFDDAPLIRRPPPQAPPRRFLGLFPMPGRERQDWSVPPESDRSSSLADRGEPREPADLAIRADAANDAALKRRIETQIRASVGDRLRYLDVRVIDESILIQANVRGFWQRRGVERAIQNMPSLAGLKSEVRVGF